MSGGRSAAPLAFVALSFLIALPCGALSAQEQGHERVAAHRGAVLSLVPDASGERLLSVGEDGFLVEWDRASKEAVSRFQLSPYALTSIALSPDGEQFAVVETDGLGLYRVSAWELKSRKKLFTLRFKDRVSYLVYSAGGSFLVAAREAREGVSIMDAKSGAMQKGLPELAGPVSFAATGRSEKTMIAYSTVGLLSYWDLASGTELKRVQAPPALSSPVLFGNNRYFAGFDGEALVVMDAVTGLELVREPTRFGTFAVPTSEGSSSLTSISVDGLIVSLRGHTIPRAEVQIAPPPLTLAAAASAATGAGTEIFLGLRDGTVADVDLPSGELSAFTARARIRLNDIALSGKTLFAVSGKGHFSLPADLDEYRENASFAREEGNGEDRVLPAPVDGNGERFLLWRTDGSAPPIVRGIDGTNRPMNLPTGVPFRSASVYGGQALFLDTAGAITVCSLTTGEPAFSFASLGILDAVLSEGRILAGKSRAIPPYVPLLAIDSVTGETAPVDIEGTAVVRLHRGSSGAIYAVLADKDVAGPKTSIVRLTLAATTGFQSLVQYRAEDVEASIAEVGLSIATTLGGDGATLVRDTRVVAFERTDALPIRVVDGGGYFVVVDSDGGVSWHDPESGVVEASLRLYEGRWEMDRKGKRFGGPLL